MRGGASLKASGLAQLQQCGGGTVLLHHSAPQPPRICPSSKLTTPRRKTEDKDKERRWLIAELDATEERLEDFARACREKREAEARAREAEEEQRRRRQLDTEADVKFACFIIRIQAKFRGVIARRRFLLELTSDRAIRGLAMDRAQLATDLAELQRSIYTLRYPPSDWRAAAVTVQRWWRCVLHGRIRATLSILTSLRRLQGDIVTAAIRIQRSWRGRLGRAEVQRRWQHLQREADEQKKLKRAQQQWASLKLQGFSKIMAAKKATKAQQVLLEQKRAAELIDREAKAQRRQSLFCSLFDMNNRRTSRMTTGFFEVDNNCRASSVAPLTVVEERP